MLCPWAVGAGVGRRHGLRHWERCWRFEQGAAVTEAKSMVRARLVLAKSWTEYSWRKASSVTWEEGGDRGEISWGEMVASSWEIKARLRAPRSSRGWWCRRGRGGPRAAPCPRPSLCPPHATPQHTHIRAEGGVSRRRREAAVHRPSADVQKPSAESHPARPGCGRHEAVPRASMTFSRVMLRSTTSTTMTLVASPPRQRRKETPHLGRCGGDMGRYGEI